MSDPIAGREPLNDAQLVEAVLDGDCSAFGTLVERYQDRLYNMLVRVLGSREDAQDVSQEAFVQAFNRLDSFRGAARFYTWLYRVAMNLAISHLRRGKRGRLSVSIDRLKTQAGEEPVGNIPGPDRAMLEKEQADQVQQALLKLNDEHRQVLVLREMEDCSYETIAEVLELPIGTVRSRLFRARMQLKEHLSNLLANEPSAQQRTAEG